MIHRAELVINLDDVDYTFITRSCSFESYNTVSMQPNYLNKTKFMYDNVITPKQSSLDELLMSYPGFPESFWKQYNSVYEYYLRDLSRSGSQRFEEFKTGLGSSAVALLKMFNKEMTTDNYAMALIIVDAMHCLRHLRAAHSGK